MQDTIFYGNGVNFGARNSVSWNDLLTKLGEKYSLENKFDDMNSKHTMYYEQVVMKCDLQKDIKEHEEDIKTDIAESISRIEPTEYIRQLASLKVTNFITTNYDNSLRKTFQEISLKINEKFYPNRETIYSIRRGYELSNNKKSVRIWYVHGEVDHPKTIMLGYDQYCSSTSKIDQYVKGKYSSKDTGKVDSIIERLIKKEIMPESSKSWIDLFFSSNVHIIGFGLDYSEIDVWWILNYRARLMRSNDVSDCIKNTIYYYGDSGMDIEKIRYLRAFNVEVILKEPHKEYGNFYEELFNNFR